MIFRSRSMISNVIKVALAAVANKMSAAVSNDPAGDEISYGFDSFFSPAGPSRAILAAFWTGRGPKREAVQAWCAEERGRKGGDRRTPSSRYPSLFSSPLVRHPATSLPSRSLSLLSLSCCSLSVFSLSAALSCAFRHAAFRSVSPVTDCRSGDRDNNNCQRSNISQASRGRERAWRWRRGGGRRARERQEEKGSTGLFIEPATNIEQLVSIRPVIATFTQSLSYPLAKWRCGHANIPLFPGTSKYKWQRVYRAIF